VSVRDLNDDDDDGERRRFRGLNFSSTVYVTFYARDTAIAYFGAYLSLSEKLLHCSLCRHIIQHIHTSLLFNICSHAQ